MYSRIEFQVLCSTRKVFENMMKSIFVTVVVMFFVGVEGAGNCDRFPCLNDGTCFESTTIARGYTCQCSTGYKGDNCEDGETVTYIDSRESSSDANAQQFLKNNDIIPYNLFKFHVKTSEDKIYIILRNDKTDYYDPIYVAIGNKSSVISSENTYSDSIGTYGLLSASEFRPFWISWNATTVSVGQYDTVGYKVFMSLTENKILDIKLEDFFAVGKSTSYWRIPKALNECDVDPCLNGGKCKDGINNLTCVCPMKYTGPTCTDVNPCVYEPCGNGGTCLSSGADTYTCLCVTGYSGKKCEVPVLVRNCNSYPCLNDGKCSESVNSILGYTCNCIFGYKGDNCEDAGEVEYIDIYTISSYQRGQQFLENMNIIPFNHFKFSVKAPRNVYVLLQSNKTDYAYGSPKSYSIIIGGWHNKVSSILSKESSVNLISDAGILSDNEFRLFWISWNATTVSVGQSDKVGDKVFMYVTESKILDIIAVSIATGPFATVHWKIPKALNECDVDPCLNGGKCKDGISNLTCVCPIKYTGPTCTDVNPCVYEPCGNGGTCLSSGADTYTCICVTGFSGKKCEVLVLVRNCDSYPCLNDGKCSESVNSIFGYTCNCIFGYKGDNCEDAGEVEYIDIYTISSYQRGQQFLENMNIIPFNHFKFSVKAPRNVYVLLQSNKTDYAYGSPKSYSIIIGGWHNKVSSILSKESSTDFISDVGMLSDSEFRSFWISWNATTVSVGQSDKVGDKVFMYVTESKILDIIAVSISTGPFATVHWKIPKAMNECDIDPCLNGGACKDGINSLTCICPKKYTGPNCADEQ